MICKLNIFLKIVLLLLYSVTVILGYCEIRFPNNPLIKPHLKKIIGSRKIQISNKNDIINLHNNQEIVASCDITFEEPDNYKYRSELNIRCSEHILYVDGNGYSRGIYLQCSSLKWNLYELLEPFAWCPSHMTSYNLARPNAGGLKTYTNLAGICYDTDNMVLSSIYYTVAPPHNRDLSPSTLSTYESQPVLPVNYVKDTFEMKSVTSENYDNKQFKDWIKFANYEYNSTIQNSILYNEVYNEFGSLLDFQWWPNLRLGNWQIYEEALAKHIEKESKAYDILAGISGVVKAPIKESCEHNYTMKNLIDDSNNQLPLYVWNYLNPKFNIGVDPGIVIIGFNSPFNEFYAEADVVFCQDICHTIDWLENVRSTFRYNTMGIVFCCSVEDVRSSKHLDNFPQQMTKIIQETTLKPGFYQTTTTEYNVDVDYDFNVEIENDY